MMEKGKDERLISIKDNVDAKRLHNIHVNVHINTV